MSTFKKLYNEQIKDSLMKQFNYKSIMEVPKLEKIVVNMGVGEASHDSKYMEAALKDLEAITGQKAVVTNTIAIPLSFRI